MAHLDLIGDSAQFRALLNNVYMAAPLDSAVLIQGETGTGKKLVARAIHEGSPRHKNRFVVRLNVFPISLPPLRERRGDVRLLAEYFVRKFSEQQGKTIDEIPEEVMITLEQHYWPGNIRELQNVRQKSPGLPVSGRRMPSVHTSSGRSVPPNGSSAGRMVPPPTSDFREQPLLSRLQRLGIFSEVASVPVTLFTT